MLGKISQMLGGVMDWGKNAFGSIKNNVGKGYEMLKNGAMKTGRFISDNHEAIGNIVGGIGNILNNMPNSPLKQKMEQGLGGATTVINKFSNLRPSNQQRQQFNNNIINKQNMIPNNKINNFAGSDGTNIPMSQNTRQMNSLQSRLNKLSNRSVI